MADRQVKIDILADEKGFTKGVGQASTSASTLEKALGKLGPVGKVAQGVLDKIGLSSITSAAGIAGGITAAAGVAAAVIEKSIASYTALGDKIRAYSIVTAQSAEVSSRQVQAFEELGVSADVAQAGMFRLAKTAAEAPAHLTRLGVEVAKDARGNIDLNQTLLNLMNAYQGTADAGKRAALVFAAFGKGGQVLLPILETNAAQLKRLEEQVAKVYTQKDLDQVREYKLAQQELQKSQEEWGLNVGQKTIGPQLSLYQSMNQNVYVMKNMDAELIKLTGSTNGTRAAITEADRALRQQWLEAHNATQEINALAQAQQDAAAAAKAEADAEQALADDIHKSKDAQFAYTQSQFDLEDALKRVKDAKGKDQQANLNLREAYFKTAYAALALKESQAEASGTALTQAQQTDVLIGSLRRMEKGLAKNSPLRKEIDAYIAQLMSIPGNINTNITATHKNVTQSTGKSGTRSFDAGGMVPGPPGSAQPAIVHGGEMVLTPDQQKALGTGAASGGRGGDTHIHLHVGMVIAPPGGMDWLARELLQRARYAPGT